MEIVKETLKNEIIGPIAVFGIIALIITIIYHFYRIKEKKKDL